MRLFPHVIGEVDINGAADEVINGIAIPGNSKLKHVWIDYSMVADAPVDILDACMYGVTAYIIPIPDPDAGTTLDTLWDEMIPKDDSIDTADSIDLDFVDTADATPEIEPGDPSIEELFNVGGRPERIFERTELITFGKQSAGFIAGTPNTYMPRDAWKGEIKRQYTVELPSVLLFGASSPAMTGAGSNPFTPQTNQAWLQLRYMADTAKDAWKFAVGLIETGAETPYIDAAILMSDYLERFFVQTTGAFVPVGYRIFTDMRYEVEVEGELSVESISAGA